MFRLSRRNTFYRVFQLNTHDDSKPNERARTISDNRKPALVRLFRVPTRGARPRASDFGRPSYALAIRDPPRPEKQPNIKRRRGLCNRGWSECSERRTQSYAYGH